MGADGHFRAFSFVDRIRSPGSGPSLHGSYAIPAGIPAFPAALVAESVGQLAAWAAMSAVDFRSRPVAGLAAEIDLLSVARPGQVLELAVDMEAVDEDAVAYHGTASVEGRPVVQLRHCVGPMMPVEQFDDPRALRGRHTLLCSTGAAPGGFTGVVSLPLERTGGEPGQWSRAVLDVPKDAPFFRDHFPRQHVLPGSLLMDSSFELVGALAASLPVPPAGGRWGLQGVSDVKLRAFTPPGDRLEIEARLGELSADGGSVDVQIRKGKRLIGSFRVRLVREGTS